MIEGMPMSEKMREAMGLPEGVEETVKILREAVEGPEKKRGREIVREQIDNLLEAAFDVNSGLSPKERQGIQEAAQLLKDSLDQEDMAWDDLKEKLEEVKWFAEGEEMTKATMEKYGTN